MKTIKVKFWCNAGLTKEIVTLEIDENKDLEIQVMEEFHKWLYNNEDVGYEIIDVKEQKKNRNCRICIFSCKFHRRMLKESLSQEIIIANTANTSFEKNVKNALEHFLILKKKILIETLSQKIAKENTLFEEIDENELKINFDVPHTRSERRKRKTKLKQKNKKL